MMDRRTFLGGLAAVSVPVVATAALSSSSFDAPEPLDTLDLREIARFHSKRLAEVMAQIDPSHRYRTEFDFENSFVLIVGDKIR